MRQIIRASLLGLLPFLYLGACSSDIDDAKSEYASGNVATNFEGGITTGEIKTDATTDQIMVANRASAVADTAVTFPPGSLAVNTSIAIGVATDQSSAILVENGVSGATVTSTPVYIAPATGTPPAVLKPLTVQIPLPVDKLSGSTAGLLGDEAAQDEASSKLVIIYNIFKDGVWKSGLIPLVGSNLIGTLAKFEIEGLGYFQIANLTAKTTKKEKEGASSVQAALSPDQEVKETTAPVSDTTDNEVDALANYQGYYSGIVTEKVNLSVNNSSYGNGKYCAMSSDNFKINLSRYNILSYRVASSMPENVEWESAVSFSNSIASPLVAASSNGALPSQAAITDLGINSYYGVKVTPAEAYAGGKFLKISFNGNFKGTTSKSFEGILTVERGPEGNLEKICEYNLLLSKQ